MSITDRKQQTPVLLSPLWKLKALAYSITEFTGYFEFFRLYEYIVKLDIYELWILFLFSLLGAVDDIYIDEVCINQQTNKTIF